jgi:phosphoenolpyruvate carboxykinase (ATP)
MLKTSKVMDKPIDQNLFPNTKINYQLAPGNLVEQCLQRQEGTLNDTGALVISTGKFTGRSPADKFIVKDNLTAQSIDWNKFNNPIAEDFFYQLRSDMVNYLDEQPEIWIRDVYAVADPAYRVKLRVVNETPSSNHFAANMFIAPPAPELDQFEPEWLVIQAPGFGAIPALHGTRQSNFTAVSFTHKTVLIGGTGYTGELKKAVFTILNFILPLEHRVLSMHCSANQGMRGDTALFFGLSGTGKTTLSADPARMLIGDDEHGWDEKGIFNCEGGCYAKVINLSPDQEPGIFQAIRAGALVENTGFIGGTTRIDFTSKLITENTRASYPLHFIPNTKSTAMGGLPQNIFFLTCDAYGVFPPLSRLSYEQAMYHFINGYTAKVAGTEAGVTEPQITFSACFGAPFLPLHPTYYAELLKEKLEKHGSKVWMINTGWTGGPYGIGKRISLGYTRAMISAALGGELDNLAYRPHEVFGVFIPESCPGVPTVLLNPRDTWDDRHAYDLAAAALMDKFSENYANHEDHCWLR